MASIPHAPPGVVPDMLDVRQDDSGLYITNTSDRKLWAKVALVVLRGRSFDRCSTWADEQPKSCTRRIGKDGTETIDSCRNLQKPALPPGEPVIFKFDRCWPAFEKSGMLEFKVFDEIESSERVDKQIVVRGKDHPVFQSDSAFVPDIW